MCVFVCVCRFKKTNNALPHSRALKDSIWVIYSIEVTKEGLLRKFFSFNMPPHKKRSEKGIKIENSEQHKYGDNKLKPETSFQVPNVISGYGKKPKDTSLTSSLRLSSSQICN